MMVIVRTRNAIIFIAPCPAPAPLTSNHSVLRARTRTHAHTHTRTLQAPPTSSETPSLNRSFSETASLQSFARGSALLHTRHAHAQSLACWHVCGSNGPKNAGETNSLVAIMKKCESYACAHAGPRTRMHTRMCSYKRCGLTSTLNVSRQPRFFFALSLSLLIVKMSFLCRV